MRGLAVGASGTIYVNTWSGFFAILPEGGAETRTLDASHLWAGGEGSPPGYIVVDEARGWVYGLERNLRSGALYRWPVAGGAAEWLNHATTGGRDPEQYLSDGPVETLEMANPAGLAIDGRGFVYIGAGDGRTFRRYDPDSGIVQSLCRMEGAEPDDNRFEWCIGDGVRNRLFNTWPSILSFDGEGNGFFGYSVWPRLIRLRREM